MRNLPPILLVVAFAGCQDRALMRTADVPTLAESLFSSSGELATARGDDGKRPVGYDSRIERFLAAAPTVNRGCNVAVLHTTWHPALTGKKREYTAGLEEGLSGNHVGHLPDLLLGGHRDISAIRNAAARLQRELVLILDFRLETHRVGWFGGGDIVTYGSLDVLVFHTRTGLIPYTTTIDVDNHWVPEKDLVELGEHDALSRAQHRSMVASLQKLGIELEGFVSSIEAGPAG